MTTAESLRDPFMYDYVSTNQPTNQPINQRANQSIDQLINQSTNQFHQMFFLLTVDVGILMVSYKRVGGNPQYAEG